MPANSDSFDMLELDSKSMLEHIVIQPGDHFVQTDENLTFRRAKCQNNSKERNRNGQRRCGVVFSTLAFRTMCQTGIKIPTQTHIHIAREQLR